VPILVQGSAEYMTFLDVHPIDPREAQFKVIATLVLLSELGVIGHRETHSATVTASGRARSLPPKRTARGGSRLVRPPRSC
jgi:hypothetical protein